MKGYLRWDRLMLPIKDIEVTPTGFRVTSHDHYVTRKIEASGPLQLITARDNHIVCTSTEIVSIKALPGDTMRLNYDLSIDVLRVADGEVNAR